MRPPGPRRLVSTRLLTIGVTLLLWPAETAPQSNKAEEILARATRYVSDFVTRFSNVVAEERYVQQTTMPPRRRQLTSDFLLVKLQGSDNWYQFRDVFEVDGKPVRDHEDRLTDLFVSPSKTTLEHARKIASESARYNLVDIGTLNSPLTALSFLQRRYQSRFRFSLGRLEKEMGPDVWLVNYEEWVLPTVIRKQGNANVLAHGRFWIEEKTGRVVKSELLLGSETFPVQIMTLFQFDDRLQISVPVEMREWHPVGTGGVTGVATYGAFRRFEVRTEETVR